MDEFSAYEKLGIGGVVAMFGFQLVREGWKRWISKDYVSFGTITELSEKIKAIEKSLNESPTKKEFEIQMERIGRHLDNHLSEWRDHKISEAKEDIKIGIMESEQKNLMEKVDSENNHIFSQLKSLHEKLDAITRIMLERKSG